MKRRNLVLCAVLAITALAVGGCSRESAVELPQMANVEPIAGTDFNKITLTDTAYQNLAIETTAAAQESVAATAGATAKSLVVIPMTALVFSPDGSPFVYTNPAPKAYVRAPLVIDSYRGSDVVLSKGPAAGTQVVTVGDPALLGIEYGVGDE